MKKTLFFLILLFVSSNKAYSMHEVEIPTQTIRHNLGEHTQLNVLKIMENLLIHIIHEASQRYLANLHYLIRSLENNLKNQAFLDNSLLSAIKEGYLNVAAFLIKKRANINFIDPESGESINEIIVKKGCEKSLLKAMKPYID